MSALTQDFVNNNVICTQVTAAVALTADAQSTAVDMRGYNAVAFVVNVGIEGVTLSGSVKFDFRIQDSSDNSTFAAAANADVLDGSGNAGTTVNSITGTFATADANAEIPAQFIGIYTGTARYVRVSVDATGTMATGTPIAITAIRAKADTLPAA